MKPFATSLLLLEFLGACATTSAARLESNLPAAASGPTTPAPDAGMTPAEPLVSPRAGRDVAAAQALTARLAALPRCERGATVGQVSLSAAACTRMACPEACCNACTWTATFVSTNGVPLPVAPSQAAAVLGVTERALDCEVTAWNGVLRGRDVGLDGAGCVVR